MYYISLIYSGLQPFWRDLAAAAEIQVYFLSQEPNLMAVKLSHNLEYACRVLAQLARTHGQEKLAHIDELAEAEKIPANYLVQILNELRNAGLIVSKRGKQGGYALARAPERVASSGHRVPYKLRFVQWRAVRWVADGARIELLDDVSSTVAS